MSDTGSAARLLMSRSRFAEMEVEGLSPAPEAADGEVVFKVDRFGLTVNNVTYATFGERLRYWRFFPVEREGMGQVPVWGYGDVVESRVAGIEAGQRFYGYWPTATHLKVQPGKVGSRAFRDDIAHRTELPEIYNWYQRTDDDALHEPANEPLHAIYRPLLVTAFCVADYLAANRFFDAERVLISSASSKTAYATAFCIRQQAAVPVIGLTSAGNRDFVDQTRVYDSALAYAELDALGASGPTLYIDIAGNTELQASIHRRLGASLVHDCSVGAAQSVVPPQPRADLPGPRPAFFFAPDWIARRHRDWGAGEFDRRAGEATAAFFQHVQAHDLLAVQESHGLSAARQILREMLDGRTAPNIGHVVQL